MRNHTRWMLLAVGVPVYTALLMVVASLAAALIFDPTEVGAFLRDVVFEPEYWLEPLWWTWCGGPVLVIVATQALFVIPMVRLRIEPAERGRSILAAVAAGALIGAMLTAGLLAAMLELFGSWPEDVHWGWSVTLPALAASWLFWTLVFWAFTKRRRDPGALSRIAALLLAGTVVELLAVIPVDVMVRRRTDCYCATGTFHALLIAAFAAMWLAGPGAAVLYLRRRRRMAATRCARCGYRKGPAPGPACPECGYAWAADL